MSLPQAQSYFSPRRIGHVNLWVDDLSASEAFYSNIAGLRVEFTEPDLIASFLGTGHTPHDLGMMEVTRGKDRYGRNGIVQLPGTIGLSPGLNHLAWELENEEALVAAFKRLKADDIATDLTVDHQVAHSVYMFDPDGNYNEFYCDTIRDWRSVLTGPMELLTEFWDPLTAAGTPDRLYEETPALATTPGAPIAPWRITHAVLMTPELDRLENFYVGIGGLKVMERHTGAGRRLSYLRGGLDNYHHSLILIEDDRAHYGRACFQLRSENDLAAARSDLDRRGVAIEASIDLPWKTAIFLRDPDGMLSEYYVRRTGQVDLKGIDPSIVHLAA